MVVLMRFGSIWGAIFVTFFIILRFPLKFNFCNTSHTKWPFGVPQSDLDLQEPFFYIFLKTYSKNINFRKKINAKLPQTLLTFNLQKYIHFFENGHSVREVHQKCTFYISSFYYIRINTKYKNYMKTHAKWPFLKIRWSL